MAATFAGGWPDLLPGTAFWSFPAALAKPVRIAAKIVESDTFWRDSDAHNGCKVEYTLVEYTLTPTPHANASASKARRETDLPWPDLS